ncbi:MAG: glycoside hydrolase family 3 C-terminal domain-containing protein [Fimbriimonadaceae bacterium]
MLLSSLLFAATAAQATIVDLNAKVDQALATMTQAEKLRLIGGYRGFDVQPIPSLGSASVRMSDGPVGVRNFGPTTAYTAGVALAATFDQALMHDVGDAIGKDARGRGVGFWLGPGVNLARIVQNGRNFEYFGEDPWLSSRCAVNVIEGVQSHGVAATVKHFALNNHEDDRNQDSSDADERVMRELYLKPFEAAVKEAHVWAVMCSYNKVNGTYASANKWLLTDVLKKDWGFQGVLMSDWGAAHDGVADFNAGLDLEMPGAEFMTPTAMADALAAGKIDQATLDDKVRRILRVLVYNDMLGPTRVPTTPRDDPKNAAVALREAEEGTVLLKNTGVLPLAAPSGDVLVLGPNALRPITGGGGSAYTTPLHSESLLDALKRKYPGAHTVAGLGDVLGNPFQFNAYDDLSATYFKGVHLQGAPVVTRPERRINNVWSRRDPSPAGYENFSVRWTGHFHAAIAGDYLAVTRSDDGVRVWIDGNAAIDHWDDHSEASDVAHLHLAAGKHDVRVEYYQAGGEAIAQFGLVELNKIRNNPALNAALKNADAVILGVGFNPGTEGEGHDRPFDLPFEQQLLLDAATTHSKKVIVVVNSGAGVNITPWVGKAAAIIEAWYPGQEGAQALTNIIDGDVNPSGKLPTTFPATLKGTYYADAYPPVNHHVRYSEGLLTGYRWFDTMHKTPLFAFGFGLSYTTFRVDHWSVAADGNAKSIAVSATVKNTGKVFGGAETVQVYVGPKNLGPGEPLKRLKAFGRVTLAPGESGEFHATIPFRELANWDTPEHRWVLTPGRYVVYVGTSSANVKAVGITVDHGETFAP